MEKSNQNVQTLKPIAPWLGGKSKLVGEIVPLVTASDHRTYVEVFFGMGAVFFARPNKPKAEFINDRNGEVSNLFRVMQRHSDAFIEMVRWMISSSDEFQRLKAQKPETLTDLERAARFLYLQKNAFGGKAAGASFGISSERGRLNVATLVDAIRNMHRRLDRVTILNEDWSVVIDRLDGPKTFFYLDPPYYGGENDYGRNLFSVDDYSRMAEALAGIQGAFLLSLNDTPEIRDIFSAFELMEVSTQYSIAKTETKDVKELIFSNRSLSRRQESLFT